MACRRVQLIVDNISRARAKEDMYTVANSVQHYLAQHRLQIMVPGVPLNRLERMAIEMFAAFIF